jgi:hypothetical protein
MDVESIPVPAGCTLPTAERPLRLAEFADVLDLVRAAERSAPTRLLLTLEPAPGRAEAVRELAFRESLCCAFFGFAVREVADGVLLEVTVPATRVGVLDAMAAHAAQVVATVGRA